MKPIEPGCLAMVVGAMLAPEVVGATVTVIGKSGSDFAMTDLGPLQVNEQLWCIDAGEHYPCPFGSGWVIQERYLMRIDGGEAESVENEEEREVPA